MFVISTLPIPLQASINSMQSCARPSSSSFRVLLLSRSSTSASSPPLLYLRCQSYSLFAVTFTQHIFLALIYSRKAASPILPFASSHALITSYFSNAALRFLSEQVAIAGKFASPAPLKFSPSLSTTSHSMASSLTAMPFAPLWLSLPA